MKKLMFLGLILTLLSAGVSAQQSSDESFRRHRSEHSDDLTRPEMHRLYKDHQRIQRERHRDYRDSRISRRERHRLHRMHRHERREFHLFRHHRHHRAL